MPQISHSTLLLTVQAIAHEIRELQETIDAGEAVPEDFPMMDDLRDAARELRREYEAAAQSTLNMPPYDELVG